MKLRTLCLTSGYLLGGLVAFAARAEGPLPTAEGTTWRYVLNDEPGGPSALQVRIAGTQDFEGKPRLKFETVVDGDVTKTELIDSDNRGVFVLARTGRDGVLAKLEPPELIFPASLKPGGNFEVEGDVAGVRMQQRYTVVAEENVLVPAGSIHAFRVHCDATSLMSVAIDRWLAPGIGIVRQVTAVRGPSGGLLQRTTMELEKRPEVVAPPAPTPSPLPSATPTMTPAPTAAEPVASPAPAASPGSSGKRLTVEVSSDPETGMKTEFKGDVEKIYVRWHGHALPEGARVRVAWVAEDVGGLVDPNFIVDETETVAPSPDASARFTLGRPEDGWAEGKYRVEFYIDDQLEEKIAVTIK